MRVVVDTNIAFSSILNTNSRIARIILQPKTSLNFYSTEQLLSEIEEHKGKLKKLSKYSDSELNRAVFLINKKIRFINPGFIPKAIFAKAENLARDIDIDDTEFIALTEHIRGKFWSGDTQLRTSSREKKMEKICQHGRVV
ncbi:MAG: PIN domain-containing protein [Flavobacteriales bacterium]|nr:PIN domain-containing protein [Flavobacteriales bacterium]